MSATADKARYFLEQSVPELKEYERKKIFSPEEITSITKKRSAFEHKINARGSSPSDYAQYAEFEINIDALRRRRVKRLGVKSTAFNGQRRIYFVLDRGTRKFPGDIGLWMQSIEYAKQQKAYKKLSQMFTSVLRLHPTKSEIWIYAAQSALDENGDMTEARSYMQRGMRFCKNSRTMWLEYARLELAYMSKIHARRQILGIEKQTSHTDEQQEQDEADDLMRLPVVTAEDINPDAPKDTDIDPIALQNLDKTPVMSGAIPLAIFDAAMHNFRFDAALGHLFFDLFAEFKQLPMIARLLDHIVERLQINAARHWQTQACYVSLPLIRFSPDQPEYPAALRETFKRMQEALAQPEQKAAFLVWCRHWLEQQIQPDMDPALQQVITARLHTLSS